MHSFFEDHKLLNACQPWFWEKWFYINHLVFPSHEFFSAFECNPSLDMQGVFLDLSKVFDKIWHDGLTYNLKLFSISGSLLKLIQNYLDNPFQWILLNGETS